MYPANNSSAPSPLSTTFTSLAANADRKYSGTQLGLESGSSRCHWMRGNAANASSSVNDSVLFSLSSSASSPACCDSLYVPLPKPIEYVCCGRATAAT